MSTTIEPEDTESSGAEASAAVPEAVATETVATEAEPELLAAVEEMIDDLSQHGGAVPAKTAEFEELDDVPSTGSPAALENLLEVSVVVTAELGRTTTSIGKLLRLNVGSVVELERLISDPVDLMAQGVRLARGEVVVVDDRFAIRIQEIVDAKKRV
jgi:flagellar motor switch protein FliN